MLCIDNGLVSAAMYVVCPDTVYCMHRPVTRHKEQVQDFVTGHSGQVSAHPIEQGMQFFIPNGDIFVTLKISRPMVVCIQQV